MTRTDARALLTWCILLGASGTLAALLLNGCGPTSVQLHARAATATGVTLGAARATLLDARAADLDSVEHATEGQSTEARLAAVEARSAQWRPALDAWELTRAALASWVEAIALAHAADAGDSLLAPAWSLAARVLALWGPLTAVLAELGVDDLPELPAVLSGLVGGGR